MLPQSYHLVSNKGNVNPYRAMLTISFFLIRNMSEWRETTKPETVNQLVTGSSPVRGAIFPKTSATYLSRRQPPAHAFRYGRLKTVGRVSAARKSAFVARPRPTTPQKKRGQTKT